MRLSAHRMAQSDTLVFLLTLTVVFSLSFLVTSDQGWCSEVINNIKYQCMDRNLSSIPPEIPSSTQQLDFSFNPLLMLTPKYFARFPSLMVLDLTRCSIEVMEDNSFEGLKNLTILILTGNPLRYLGARAFYDLLSLQKLSAVEMNLSSLGDLPIGHLLSLQELNLCNNHIKTLKIPESFCNLTSLRVVDLHSNKVSDIVIGDLNILKEMNMSNLTIILSNNIINHIQPGAFKGIHIHKLSLRNCFQNNSIMRTCLQGLVGLQVNKLEIGSYKTTGSKIGFEEGLLVGLCKVELQELILICFKDPPGVKNTLLDCLINASSIRLVNSDLHMLTTLSKFARLSYLELRNCHSLNIHLINLATSSTLKVLKITKCFHVTISKFYGLLKLVSLDLTHNQIIFNECCSSDDIGTPYLRYLNLSFNSLITMTSDFEGLGELLSLDFQNTKLSKIGTIPTFLNLGKLLYLDISYTSTHFFIHCAFCGLESLQVLKIAGNLFEGNILSQTFGNSIHLRILDISNCKLEGISLHTFSGLNKLQELRLSQNKLLVFDSMVYTPLLSLIVLNLSSNQLSFLSENDVESLPRLLVHFDLSQNPFDCSCTHLSFLQWVQNQTKLLQNTQFMTCKNPAYLNNVKVMNVTTSSCNTNLTPLAVSLGMLLPVALTVFLAYKCYIQHYYRLVLSRCYMDSTEEEDKYDAFVIFSSKDEEWVMAELVENLEGSLPPFRLCLHFRDFTPGVPIASNIIQEGFLKSRKAIVVISENFMESRWCGFEFELAQSWQFLEGNAGIIVIVLQQVNKSQLRQMLGLHKYLRRNTYLEWKENKLDQHLFWTRLRNALMEGKSWKARKRESS
ncbi:toll-like receptor 4 [Rhinatrema bivittatum]|uniref:toll-like receptor 4 n=1 Tax=Rhinatrema bivittatum TaxID=194408 RepID=UPI00112A0AC0|nr:toll-like receptor 4 [Rhinatrema bivittatum]